MNWHYVEEGQQAGPVTDEQLAELVRTGKINDDSLVWHGGLENWTSYGQVKPGAKPPRAGASAAAAARPAMAVNANEAVCNECGNVFPVNEMIAHGNVRICANCKPVFMQKLAEGAQINTGELNYAGFGIRFAAKILDGLILGIPLGVLFAVVMVPMVGHRNPAQLNSAQDVRFNLLIIFIEFGFFFIQMAYVIFFLGKYGATPGKMICKLKVVTSEGGRIGYGRATGRFFSEMLSGMICYIGYLMVIFDNPEKRALHDHICNTRVIYK